MIPRRAYRDAGALALAAALLTPGCSEADETPPPTASATATVSAPTPSAAPTASASAEPAWVPPWETTPPPDAWGEEQRWKGTLAEQNAHMLDQMEHALGITKAQREELEAIFTASERAGQGNPAVAKHKKTVAECRQMLADEKVDYDDPASDTICRDRYMAPVYDPETQKAEDATVCVDRFEFPNIPCTYPVTWVRANEAAAMCEAVGKRLCDAHEWEDACHGALRAPEEAYNYGLVDRFDRDDAVKRMRTQQNIKNHEDRRWAYGPKYQEKVCATGSWKSKDCGVGWRNCGTNTYPSGFFPGCKSPLGVYDQHGNAAEHMNLPLKPDQLSATPDGVYGQTEMKGSWFIFDEVKAHEDYCRWRAPFWHGTRVMNEKSHRNYHLGFRCCKTVGPGGEGPGREAESDGGGESNE